MSMPMDDPPLDPLDPQRPLYLAVRLMRLLGGLLLLLAVGAGVPLLLRPGRMPVNWWMLAALTGSVLPGVGLIVLSILLPQRRKWIIAASIGVAAFASLFPLLVVLQILLALSRRDVPLAILFPMAIALLTVAALGQLIYQLARSFAAARQAPQQRGFEPILTTDTHEPPPPVD
jgi:hypothetical protein